MVVSGRAPFLTTLRESFSSRQICLIGLCCTKYARRIFATNILREPSVSSMGGVWMKYPGGSFGHRSPRKRGPYPSPDNKPGAATGAGEVTTTIAGVAGRAEETGAAASQVLSASSELSRQSEHLTAEVARFPTTVRAARDRVVPGRSGERS